MTYLLSPAMLRYIGVGVSVYLLELGVILVALERGASGMLAVTLSYTIGLIVSFLLQKLFTFRDKRLHHVIVLRQVLATVALVVWNLAFTLLLVGLMEHITSPMFARTLALGITTLWNFYLYKTHIFRPDAPRESAVA